MPKTIEEKRALARIRTARYANKHPERIKAHNKAYYHANSEKESARLKAWREANPDIVRGYNAKQAEKDKAEGWARTQQWKQDNPAKVKASTSAYYHKNIEQRRAAFKIYQRENAESFRHRNAKRRAKIAGDPRNDLTPEQWRDIQIAQDHRCVYCHRRFKWRLTRDHITPLEEGGSYTLHNIVGACGQCNSRKKDGPVLCPVQPLLL